METTEVKKEQPIPMCDAALIEDIKLAVDIERLATEFTFADIQEWIEKDQVKKTRWHALP